MRFSKFKNKKVVIDGQKFDSKREAKRAAELALLEKAGEISNLRRQVKFELIPKQDINGKCAERAASYVADFVYLDTVGRLTVEDCKGFRTPEYILKRKLMLWLKGIRVQEI